MSGDSGSAARGGGADPEASAAVLPAPPGWIKKVMTPQKGGTPKKKSIFFIAPTGEELSTKRQVEQYLKSHPGGPLMSEFHWGAGDTPRRSARLGEKVKEVASAEPEPPTKRSRKSVGKVGDDMKTETEEVQMHDTEAEPEPPTKRSRKSVGKVGDDMKTETEEVQMHDTETATKEVHGSEDVQMHDTEATETEDVAEEDIEVKVIDAQENSELNNIGDVDAPVVPPDVANVGKEVKVIDAQDNSELNNIGDVDAPVVPPDAANVGNESIVLEDFADTNMDAAAEGPTEEISSSQYMQMSLDAEAKMMDTLKADAPEDPQLKVLVKIHEDPEEQHQGKIIKENGSEQIVEMQDVVTGETEHEDGIAEKQVEDAPQPSDPQELQQKGEIDVEKFPGTADKQVEDASQPSSTSFDKNKDEESGYCRIDDTSLEVEAAETKKPAVENSCINVEGSETEPEEPQLKVEIDLEKLPAP